MNSTAVMAFTRPEVTLQESVTCCSHSLGFRKRNLALDCWPLTIFNFIYDACQQRIATFACVAEVFWDHGASCSRCRPGLRYYPRPSASDSFPLIDSLHFLSVTARLSVNQTAGYQILNCYQYGFSTRRKLGKIQPPLYCGQTNNAPSQPVEN